MFLRFRLCASLLVLVDWVLMCLIVYIWWAFDGFLLWIVGFCNLWFVDMFAYVLSSRCAFGYARCCEFWLLLWAITVGLGFAFLICGLVC